MKKKSLKNFLKPTKTHKKYKEVGKAFRRVLQTLEEKQQDLMRNPYDADAKLMIEQAEESLRQLSEQHLYLKLYLEEHNTSVDKIIEQMKETPDAGIESPNLIITERILRQLTKEK